MTSAIAEKLYTVEEFLQMEWPDDDENDYELIEGEIVPKPGTTIAKHADIVSRITIYLGNFAGITAGEKRIGTVYSGGSTTLGKPKGSTSPKPDVCFVLNGRIPEDIEGAIPVAPDLVVEVNSPSDTDERKVAKLSAYREAGVSLIWSVSILEKYVMVYSKNRPYPQLLNLDDELDGEDVIPGFKLKVRALFE